MFWTLEKLLFTVNVTFLKICVSTALNNSEKVKTCWDDCLHPWELKNAIKLDKIRSKVTAMLA